MAPKRLSETEKQEIADRYRQPDESTATLSRTFGVSTSTIGRLLKNSFSADEYEALVQQKRLIGRGGATRSSAAKSTPELEADETESVVVSSPVTVSPRDDDGKTQQAAPKLRSRTRSRSRSRTSANSANSTVMAEDSDAQLGLSLENDLRDASISPTHSDTSDENAADNHEPASRRRRRRSSVKPTPKNTPHDGAETAKPPTVIHHVTNASDDPDGRQEDEPLPRSRKRRSRRTVVSSLSNETALLDTSEPSQDDYPRSSSAFEDSRWNNSGLDTGLDNSGLDNSSDRSDESHQSKPAIEVLKLTPSSRVSSLASPPLSEATLPKTCYLVVDRLSELISRPLQDFEELGEIPQGENQEQTLPIFDNHRVARRFANRSQRVMKIPDSRVLQKTGAHLQAKGITRVLIDGKVYSLS